ncbi:hypothetical protein POVWA2_029830 [Plasmodium ovale wallikeri]|uniref:Uncharacterized protein n=1 Tax=Plasmodium ovale wallikeri TaxID=864142 RepID=A0A1A8YXD8_PLAOA|nr:hypothetical protein POVWA1_030220 [Plasmodium ovale wallikeri]SBT36377.1 hypothetical protein POVWA2_029830 [Plasmodium ovale wallikeri]
MRELDRTKQQRRRYRVYRKGQCDLSHYMLGFLTPATATRVCKQEGSYKRRPCTENHTHTSNKPFNTVKKKKKKKKKDVLITCIITLCEIKKRKEKIILCKEEGYKDECEEKQEMISKESVNEIKTQISYICGLNSTFVLKHARGGEHISKRKEEPKIGCITICLYARMLMCICACTCMYRCEFTFCQYCPFLGKSFLCETKYGKSGKDPWSSLLNGENAFFPF